MGKSAPKIPSLKQVANPNILKMGGNKLGKDGTLGNDLERLANVSGDTVKATANLDGQALMKASFYDATMVPGQMLGVVKRESDKPDDGGLNTEGVEPPKMESITEDANDAQRKSLGRRFASRLLFGGSGSLGGSKTSSSSLLGF